MPLTHFDAQGQAHMVDVSDKDVTDRVAVAAGHIKMAQETFEIISEGRAKKVMFWASRVLPESWAPRKRRT